MKSMSCIHLTKMNTAYLAVNPKANESRVTILCNRFLVCVMKIKYLDKEFYAPIKNNYLISFCESS